MLEKKHLIYKKKFHSQGLHVFVALSQSQSICGFSLICRCLNTFNLILRNGGLSEPRVLHSYLAKQDKTLATYAIDSSKSSSEPI